MAAKTLVTTFDDVNEAEHAVQKLQAYGFAPAGLGWVEHKDHGREVTHGSLIEKQSSATLSREIIGALLGGLLILLIVAVTANVVGLRGAVFLAIAVVGAAIGALLGAAVGKRLDAIARIEIPPPRTPRYVERQPSGRTTVTVIVDDELEEARALDILRGEASLHQHELMWRVPSFSDPGRASLPSMPLQR